KSSAARSASLPPSATRALEEILETPEIDRPRVNLECVARRPMMHLQALTQSAAQTRDLLLQRLHATLPRTSPTVDPAEATWLVRSRVAPVGRTVTREGSVRGQQASTRCPIPIDPDEFAAERGSHS